MTSGILQDSLPSAGSPSTSSPRFRPYASPNHHVIKSRYITSNDPRGYIPVYEYPLNGQWIMMDVDDGYILWTGIWKGDSPFILWDDSMHDCMIALLYLAALGNSKADIVKMIESQPDLASQIRRVRGGYLKIQGTWMPYEVALRLSRRVAWPIRHDLVPLFGPTFPTTCLSPEQPGYGQVIANGGRRRARRSNHIQSSGMLSTGTSGVQAGWSIISGPTYPHEITESLPQISHQQGSSFSQPAWPSQHQNGPSRPSPTDVLSIDGGVSRLSLNWERSHNTRYSPYPSPSQPNNASLTSSVSSPVTTSRNPFPDGPGLSGSHRAPIKDEPITLPPLHPPPSARVSGQTLISLPPISSWAAAPQSNDSRAVLQRLRASDGTDVANPLSASEEQLRYQRRSSLPSNAPHLDLEPHKPLKPTTRAETQHWASERSCSQDSPRFQTLAHRRQSDSSSAVSSTSASFLSSAPDCVSPSDPSPVSPLTPHTSTPFPPGPQDSLLSSLKVLSGNSRTSIPSHTYIDATQPVFFDDREKPQKYGRRRSDDHPPPQQLHRTAASPSRKPAELRDIYGVNYSNTHPVRPW